MVESNSHKIDVKITKLVYKNSQKHPQIEVLIFPYSNIARTPEASENLTIYSKAKLQF